MSAASATARGRAAAARQFTDTFAIYKPAATDSTDSDGMETETYDPVGTTPGKVQGRGGAGQSDTVARTENIGGEDRPVVTAGLHVPVDSPAPEKGWRYVLTSAGPFTPPDLLNSSWIVVDSPAKSFMTARRLDVVRES